VLITADDALDTAVDLIFRSDGRPLAKDRSDVKKKIRKTLNLLSDFAKKFPLKDPGTVTGKVTNGINSNKNSKSPTTILQALKDDLYSNVKSPSVSLSLNTDGYQPMGFDTAHLVEHRTIKFYILKSLQDPDPIIVEGGCHAINSAPVSDSCASASSEPDELSRDCLGSPMSPSFF
jgi:hypothetical protein